METVNDEDIQVLSGKHVRLLWVNNELKLGGWSQNAVIIRSTTDFEQITTLYVYIMNHEYMIWPQTVKPDVNALTNHKWWHCRVWP